MVNMSQAIAGRMHGRVVRHPHGSEASRNRTQSYFQTPTPTGGTPPPLRGGNLSPCVRLRDGGVQIYLKDISPHRIFDLLSA